MPTRILDGLRKVLSQADRIAIVSYLNDQTVEAWDRIRSVAVMRDDVPTLTQAVFKASLVHEESRWWPQTRIMGDGDVYAIPSAWHVGHGLRLAAKTWERKNPVPTPGQPTTVAG